MDEQTVKERARAWLTEANQIVSLPFTSPERTSGMVLLHKEAVQITEDLLDWVDGYEREHSVLVRLVYELRDSAIPSSSGEDWTQEFPSGKAVIFRRSLTKLLTYLREHSS